MIAMHLGSELKRDTMNMLRYAMPLKDIVRRNPHSILQKFANGELPQGSSYRSDAYWTYLSFASHNYLIDEEGPQSEKVLQRLLSKHLKKTKRLNLQHLLQFLFQKPTSNISPIYILMRIDRLEENV